MNNVILLSLLILSGCAFAPTKPQGPMSECRAMCSGSLVEKYKDETMSCVCQDKIEKGE